MKIIYNNTTGEIKAYCGIHQDVEIFKTNWSDTTWIDYNTTDPLPFMELIKTYKVDPLTKSLVNK